LLVNGLFLFTAFVLSDAGYDVWLGNARGNVYSKRHAWLSTRDRMFWNFR